MAYFASPKARLRVCVLKIATGANRPPEIEPIPHFDCRMWKVGGSGWLATLPKAQLGERFFNSSRTSYRAEA